MSNNYQNQQNQLPPNENPNKNYYGNPQQPNNNFNYQQGNQYQQQQQQPQQQQQLTDEQIAYNQQQQDRMVNDCQQQQFQQNSDNQYYQQQNQNQNQNYLRPPQQSNYSNNDRSPGGQNYHNSPYNSQGSNYPPAHSSNNSQQQNYAPSHSPNNSQQGQQNYAPPPYAQNNNNNAQGQNFPPPSSNNRQGQNYPPPSSQGQTQISPNNSQGSNNNNNNYAQPNYSMNNNNNNYNNDQQQQPPNYAQNNNCASNYSQIPQNQNSQNNLDAQHNQETEPKEQVKQEVWPQYQQNNHNNNNNNQQNWQNQNQQPNNVQYLHNNQNCQQPQQQQQQQQQYQPPQQQQQQQYQPPQQQQQQQQYQAPQQQQQYQQPPPPSQQQQQQQQNYQPPQQQQQQHYQPPQQQQQQPYQQQQQQQQYYAQQQQHQQQQQDYQPQGPQQQNYQQGQQQPQQQQFQPFQNQMPQYVRGKPQQKQQQQQQNKGNQNRKIQGNINNCINMVNQLFDHQSQVNEQKDNSYKDGNDKKNTNPKKNRNNNNKKQPNKNVIQNPLFGQQQPTQFIPNNNMVQLPGQTGVSQNQQGNNAKFKWIVNFDQLVEYIQYLFGPNGINFGLKLQTVSPEYNIVPGNYGFQFKFQDQMIMEQQKQKHENLSQQIIYINVKANQFKFDDESYKIVFIRLKNLVPEDFPILQQNIQYIKFYNGENIHQQIKEVTEQFLIPTYEQKKLGTLMNKIQRDSKKIEKQDFILKFKLKKLQKSDVSPQLLETQISNIINSYLQVEKSIQDCWKIKSSQEVDINKQFEKSIYKLLNDEKNNNVSIASEFLGKSQDEENIFLYIIKVELKYFENNSEDTNNNKVQKQIQQQLKDLVKQVKQILKGFPLKISFKGNHGNIYQLAVSKQGEQIAKELNCKILLNKNNTELRIEADKLFTQCKLVENKIFEEIKKYKRKLIDFHLDKITNKTPKNKANTDNNENDDNESVMSNQDTDNDNFDKKEYFRKRDVFKCFQRNGQYLIQNMYKLLSELFSIEKEQIILQIVNSDNNKNDQNKNKIQIQTIFISEEIQNITDVMQKVFITLIDSMNHSSVKRNEMEKFVKSITKNTDIRKYLKENQLLFGGENNGYIVIVGENDNISEFKDSLNGFRDNKKVNENLQVIINFNKSFNKIENKLIYWKLYKQIQEQQRARKVKSRMLPDTDNLILVLKGKKEITEKESNVYLNLRDQFYSNLVFEELKLSQDESIYISKNYQKLRIDSMNNQWFCKLLTPEKRKQEKQRINKYTCKLSYNKSIDICLLNQDITKIQADAIVNSCNSELFSSDDIDHITGTAHSIILAGGENYRKFLEKQQQLPEGNLINFKVKDKSLGFNNIITVSTPFLSSDNIQNSSSKIKNTIVSIIDYCESNNFKAVGIPILGGGAAGFDFKEQSLKWILRSLIESFEQAKLINLSRIYLVEINQEKADKIVEIFQELKNPSKADIYIPKYQWLWNYHEFNKYEKYDENINILIDKGYKAFKQNPTKSEMDIYFDPLRQPGTHTVDLEKNELQDNRLMNIEKISYLFGEYFREGKPFGTQLTEYFDYKKKKGELQFQLFLKKYTIKFNQDPNQSNQVNQETNFSRQIRVEDFETNLTQAQQEEIQFFKQFQINTKWSYGDYDEQEEIQKLKKQQSQNQNQDDFKIMLYGINSENASKYKQELMQKLEKAKKTADITISKNTTQRGLKQIKALLEKHNLYKGILKQNQQIQIGGLNYLVENAEELIQQKSKFDPMEEPVDWVDQDENCKLYLLSQDDQIFQDIKSNFEQTVKNKKIVSIHRIQNKSLYENYGVEVKKMIKDQQLHGNPVKVDTIQAWHGTGTSHPKIIYEGKSEGFDTTYGRTTCMWGQGSYFAKNASYSAGGYSFMLPNGNHIMMLCQVELGYNANIPSQQLARPPLINEQNPDLGRYDSVSGYTAGSDVYILYANNSRRAYPSYLVEYE